MNERMDNCSREKNEIGKERERGGNCIPPGGMREARRKVRFKNMERLRKNVREKEMRKQMVDKRMIKEWEDGKMEHTF